MVRIIWNDIAKEPTDAVVTLASAEPKVGSGVDKFVHATAGKKLLKERLDKNPKMVPGDVVFTKSYELEKTCGAKNVIHVASVVWRDSGVEP